MNLPVRLKNNTRLVFGSDFLTFVLVILTFSQNKEVTGQTNKPLFSPRPESKTKEERSYAQTLPGTTVGYQPGHEPDSWVLHKATVGHHSGLTQTVSVLKINKLLSSTFPP